MTQIGDFLARIISAGGSRGLSGDTELVLPPEPALAYFNERLRRHSSSDDLVAEPERLWDTSGFLSRRSGLRGHLLAERGSGVVGISDVMLIINRDDWRRSFREVRRPWVDRAAAVLKDRFRRFCEDEDFHPIFPQREVHFTIVEDGSETLRGHSLNLGRGEFVTGLLPNHYAGPDPSSQPVVALHLNIPGAWEGYREIGRLWSDQVLFTIGEHWLDNFQHEALREPALYRLHRYGDGSFVHVLNPEVQEAYRITSQETPGGASVLTLQLADGTPIAYLVLAVLEAEMVAPSVSRPPVARIARTPTLDELEHGTLPDLPTADPAAPGTPPSMDGSRTVVPLELDERILTLKEQGALLQKVHFARFMEGYDVYIGRSGEIATAMARPAATLHVRGRQVSLEAHQPGVKVGGRELVAGRPVFVEGDTTISVGNVGLRYRDLSGVKQEGWPYLGELRRPGATAHMVFGSTYGIGRDPRCKVRLPDEPHNENIIWRPELRDGGTIRSRNGEIPKSRFYIDSIMVASEHAEIDVTGEPALRSRARHCYTYIRRGSEIFTLFPTRESEGPTDLSLRAGDELLIGNCVFEVQYPSAEEFAARIARTARMNLSAEDLAGSVTPSLVGVPGMPASPPPAAAEEDEDEDPITEPVDDLDVPAAAGLGERGLAPRPVVVKGSLDSTDTFTRAEVPVPRVAAPMLTGEVEDYAAGGVDVRPSMVESFDPTLTDEPASDEVEDAGAELDGQGLAADGGLPYPPGEPEEDPWLTGFEDPTGVPLSEPPPLDLEPSGDSILGEDPLVPIASGRTAPDRPSMAGGVAIVDEADWQLELSRPGRLSLLGWMVTGTVVIGNHDSADLVIPENRCERTQRFGAVDYLELFVRGRRARMNRLSPREVRLFENGREIYDISDPGKVRVEILRRDPEGEVDFVVPLLLEEDPTLPDPRARLLRIDLSDRMVQALFTLGLPLRQPRPVELGGIAARLTFDGKAMEIGNYLHGYRLPDGGFRPFFYRGPGGSFRTLPEDGSPIHLHDGDRLIAGNAVYVFESEAGHDG